MAEVQIYTIEGKSGGSMELDDAVFGVRVNADVVQAVATAQRANAHQVVAHTKGRRDVRGGGRKPWKQKGTGRARHGSSRSPIWRGGGVTFGPTNERNMSKKINKKTRQKAIRMVLSDKLAAGKLLVIDSLDSIEGKTKQLSAALNALPVDGRPALIASGEKNAMLTRAATNIPRTNTCLADSVNVLDLLKYQYLVTDKAGVEKMIAQFK